VILNVHLTDQTLHTGDGIVRSDDLGPILLSQLLDLLRDHHCQVSLRPVLDPANHGTHALGPMPTPRPTGIPKRPTVVRLDPWKRRHRTGQLMSQPV